MKKCCFFGHSQFSYEAYQEIIKSITIDLIENHEVTTFYSGGRGDFDNICARIIGELRNKYSHIENIKFLSYIPTEKKSEKYLAPYYTGTEYMLEESVIPKYAISKTNQKVVEICDYVISGVCRDYGGAKLAIRHAKRKKKTIIDIFKK